MIFKHAGEAAAQAGDHWLSVKSAVRPDPWLCQGTRRARQAGGRAEESRLQTHTAQATILGVNLGSVSQVL